jgi:hypothetical protein
MVIQANVHVQRARIGEQTFMRMFLIHIRTRQVYALPAIRCVVLRA